MISRRIRLSSMLPAVLLIASVSGAQAPPVPAPAPAAAPAAVPAAPSVPRTLDVPDGALVAAGKAPELDLLYTGDVIGFIEPCG
jgi:hypothetical protein